MSGTAQVTISKDLRDCLKKLAAEEDTTLGKIVSELIEVRVGWPSPNQFNFPPEIRTKVIQWGCLDDRWGGWKDWKQRVREYIEPLSVEESFDVPDLMHVLGYTPERLPSQHDRIRMARVVRAYLETLPGLFPGPVDPRRPFLRQYYLSKDAAEMAYEEAAVEAGREEFEQCKDD